MKNDFYVFLDIDGVVNSVEWFKVFIKENLEKEGFNQFFCPANIQNLNILLNYIQQTFNPKIVITSSWRLNEKEYKKCQDMLLKYGLYYFDKFDRTELKPRGLRGRQILNYMNKHNIEHDNFVIIDDRLKYITSYFKEKYIIKTSGLFKSGLTKANVQNYIAKTSEQEF